MLGYNKHKPKTDKSKSQESKLAAPSVAKKAKSVEFVSSSSSDSDGDSDSSEREEVQSDSESEEETPLVGSGSLVSSSIAPIASTSIMAGTSPSHTLTAAEVSAAAKLAVEKIGLGATPCLLYTSPSPRD